MSCVGSIDICGIGLNISLYSSLIVSSNLTSLSFDARCSIVVFIALMELNGLEVYGSFSPSISSNRLVHLVFSSSIVALWFFSICLTLTFGGIIFFMVSHGILLSPFIKSKLDTLSIAVRAA